MLLTISTTHQPATDLTFLLHKHPDRFQSFDVSFGRAHVFYPEVTDERTTVALVLEVDPVGLVRGKNRDQSFLLGQYVNDRPYVASSFLSVAMAEVFGTAMSGRSKDREELAKLLSKGEGWLADHPEKELIARRYLRHRSSLYREALARLAEEPQIDESGDEPENDGNEDSLEHTVSLNDQRLGTVLATLRGSGARSVVDLGCGEGKLLRSLMEDRQFERIVGMDVSIRSLEIAQRRLKIERLPDRQTDRITLIQGSLTYRDRRLEGFDAAAVIEVIEHLDPPRLAAFERVLFEFARPMTIVMTTPNQEYNSLWETLPAGQFRHADHRFEWTRTEFQDWARRVASRYGYTVRFVAVGPVDEKAGSPTQMGVFQRD